MPPKLDEKEIGRLIDEAQFRACMIETEQRVTQALTHGAVRRLMDSGAEGRAWVAKQKSLIISPKTGRLMFHESVQEFTDDPKWWEERRKEFEQELAEIRKRTWEADKKAREEAAEEEADETVQEEADKKE